MKKRPQLDRDYYQIQFDEYITDTDEAYYLNIDRKRTWIPKSITFDFDPDTDDTIFIKKWFVEKKGLEQYIIE